MSASRNPCTPGRRAWRALLTVVVAAAIPVTSVAIAAPASASQPAGRRAQFDTRILHLVNQARAQHGVPAVQSDDGLVSLAAWWSRRMANGATGGQLQHNPDAWTMLADYNAGNRTAWAENVAKFGNSTPAEALFNAYMNSPGHRANILSPRYHYIGIGTVAGPGSTYNTMEFTDRIEPGGCHPFRDVNATSVHCRNVGWLSRQEITNPAGINYFPFRPVTRQAMAAFLYRLTHQDQHAAGCRSKPFPDVATRNVFCGAIRWMANADITTGYPGGAFRPARAVSRGAMAAYLYRTVHGRTAPPCATRPFTDVPAGDVFCGAIRWMKNAGITQGTAGGSRYHPDRAVTRQAMATFVRRAAPLV